MTPNQQELFFKQLLKHAEGIESALDWIGLVLTIALLTWWFR